jgi:Carboxypeptidase regulatory-like domain
MHYRVVLLAVCCVVLAGCGGSSYSTPASPRVSATIGRAPGVLVYPTPKVSRRIKLPTAVPGTPPAHLPTLAPAPTPTTIPASDFTSAVQGTVTDAKSHSPIPGALVLVQFGLKSAKTNAFGQYHVAFPANATVSVETNAHGYGGGLAIGHLAPHRTATVNFKLNRVTKNGVAPPELPMVFGQK